jgi:hypothetical protein
MSRSAKIPPHAHASAFEFVPLALQHYVAGRMLALQLLIPVAGNVLHHAVELTFKAALADVVPLKALKFDYSHNLPRIWKRFQEEYGAQVEHDQTIDDLHRFDEIRYPGPSGGSTAHHCSIFRDVQGRRMGSPGAYSLVLEDVDALMSDVLSNRKVSFLFRNDVAQLPSFSLQCLLERNRHPIAIEPIVRNPS